MTAAIYTRYSSDLQSERSIEDQLALCKTYAQREGLTVVAAYEDRAMSGASTVQRLGLQRLLRDAAEGRFKTLVVESLDRLSRDQADMATLYKRLSFDGVTIIEVHGGKATPINAAVRGLMGTLFLADLADKTHRGMAGNIRAGKSAGGRAYGYRPVKGEAGQLVIVEHEADVVRRIFTCYASGDSPRKIAAILNENNITPIMGTRWNASTIQGRKDRGNGILGNALYRGQLVWNKVKMFKHPDTGRRISRANPASEWQSTQVPHLRIIDEDVWNAVAAKRRVYDPRGHTMRAPKHLLSGLLKCHCCGGSLVVRDRKNGVTRIRCSRFQESGACSNNRVYQLDRITMAVLDVLRQELQHPQLIEAYVREYNAERRRLSNTRASSKANNEKRLASVTSEIERTVTMMIKGQIDPERHSPRVKELESEERQLKATLAAKPSADVVTLHPTALNRYIAQIHNLQSELATGTAEADELRGLIASITVHPDYKFEIKGRLNQLIGLPSFTPTGGFLMVAGEGVEPPTPGL